MDPAFFSTKRVMEEGDIVNPANEGKKMETSDVACLKSKTALDSAFWKMEKWKIENSANKGTKMETLDDSFWKSQTALDSAFSKIGKGKTQNSANEGHKMETFDDAFLKSKIVLDPAFRKIGQGKIENSAQEGRKMETLDGAFWKSGTMRKPAFVSTRIIEEGEIVNIDTDSDTETSDVVVLKSGTKLGSAFISSRVIEEGEIVNVDSEDSDSETSVEVVLKSGTKLNPTLFTSRIIEEGEIVNVDSEDSDTETFNEVFLKSGTKLNPTFNLPSKELLRALELECEEDSSSSSGKPDNPFTPDWFALTFESKTDGRITLPIKPKLTDEANPFSIKEQHEFVCSLSLTPRPAVDHLGRPISKDDYRPMPNPNKRPISKVGKGRMSTVTSESMKRPQFTPTNIRVNKAFPIGYKRRSTMSSSKPITRMKVSGNQIIPPKKTANRSKIKPKGTSFPPLSPD